MTSSGFTVVLVQKGNMTCEASFKLFYNHHLFPDPPGHYRFDFPSRPSTSVYRPETGTDSAQITS